LKEHKEKREKEEKNKKEKKKKMKSKIGVGLTEKNRKTGNKLSFRKC